MTAAYRLFRASGAFLGAFYGARCAGWLGGKWLGRRAAFAAEEIAKEASLEA